MQAPPRSPAVGAPSRRRAASRRIGAVFAAIAGLGAILGGLTGYWSTYRAVTAELLAPPASKPMASRFSIAVLPFANLGGGSRQDYLADGITDSLTTDLSRALPGSFVVSRDTAFTYKGRIGDVRRIGRELDVRYALTGSIFPEGERLRINAKLVDAQAGAQLWAERFDVERTDLLEVQDEIVGRLARAIGLKVIDVEGRRTERERPKSTDTSDLLMRAKVIANRPSSRETMIGARDLYEQALKVEPDNIDALAGIATTFVFEVLNGYYRTGNEQRLFEAEELLARTLAVEPRHLVALKASAALRRAQGKFEEDIAAAEAVITENPGEPWAYKEIGFSTLYLGNPLGAIDWFAKADRLGPRDPARWTWLDGQGHALILLGRDEEAVRSLRAALDSNPNTVSTYAFLASAYALGGLVDKSRFALAQYQKYYPDVTVGSFRSLLPVPLKLTSQKYQQQFERLKEGLRKAGMPG
jgi:TolB-like protein/cytochrome c-type biogenesis protein CcmH/NrfG